MINTVKYQRKSFVIDAVQVTKENITEVAEWCSGEIRVQGDKTQYIKVRVHSPKNLRQTMAFENDWVLYSEAGNSYKVFTEKAFANSFEEVFRNDGEKDNEQLLREEAAGPEELLTTNEPV